MGVVMVVIFISSVLLLCGIILILAGDGGGRKAGFFLLMAGIIGIFISVISYPRDKNYIPAYEYSNESNNDYNDK